MSGLSNLDCHEIIPGLWQGSAPAHGQDVKDAGFDVLVLCASGHQPSAEEFPGVRVVRAPFDDHALNLSESETAWFAARQVASALKKRRKVLVTCVAGINRSALVAALAIHERLGYSGKACMELVRGKRWVGNLRCALQNPHFARFLERLESK